MGLFISDVRGPEKKLGGFASDSAPVFVPWGVEGKSGDEPCEEA